LLKFASIVGAKNSLNFLKSNATKAVDLLKPRDPNGIIEKLKGSPVRKEIEGTIHYIGFALLMVLILVVTVKDVSKYGDLFIGVWDKIVG